MANYVQFEDIEKDFKSIEENFNRTKQLLSSKRSFETQPKIHQEILFHTLVMLNDSIKDMKDKLPDPNI